MCVIRHVTQAASRYLLSGCNCIILTPATLSTDLSFGEQFADGTVAATILREPSGSISTRSYGGRGVTDAEKFWARTLLLPSRVVANLCAKSVD